MRQQLRLLLLLMQLLLLMLLMLLLTIIQIQSRLCGWSTVGVCSSGSSIQAIETARLVSLHVSHRR